MPLYSAMQELKIALPESEEQARDFLETLDDKVQEQLINAVYLGREHIHSEELRSDLPISREYVDHIDRADYPRILAEKRGNIPTYLDKLTECANASGFDLNQL